MRVATITRVLFYTSAGCHLCEQALALVSPLLEPLGLQLEEVEIADHDSLVELYGVRIPVVRLDGEERDLGWPFDADDFRRYIHNEMR